MAEGPGQYDPVELRRRIVVCFSVGELRALAESLGVGSINWERGLDEAAREVVRQSERYAGLPALVARLREERPDMEWPEAAPSRAVAEPSGPPMAPSRTLASALGPEGADGGTAQAGLPAPVPPVALAVPAARAIPPTAGFPALPALSASPGTLGGPEGPGILSDPYAPPPGPQVISVPAPMYAPHDGGAAASGAPPQPAPWPGTVAASAKPAGSGGGGVDPRIFVAVAGLMVVAAVIAYLAGRASSASGGAADGSDGAAASAAVRAGAGARADGPAALVADAMARSFANMARACELPPSAGANALVFQRVFARCGPGSNQRRVSKGSPGPTAADDPGADPAPSAAPSAEAAPTADPPRGRNRRPGRGGGDTPPGEAPAPSGKGCMGACDGAHASCRSHCGAEPTESGAYDGYQRCLGRCLSDASRCRLSCR